MPIKSIPRIRSRFRSSFDDDDTGVFEGRKRPEEPAVIEDKYDDVAYQDDFRGSIKSEWTVTTSGDSTATTNDGILTLNTGASVGTAKILGTQTLSLTDKKTIYLTFRTRINTDHDDIELSMGVDADGTGASGSDHVLLTNDGNSNNLILQNQKDNTATTSANVAMTNNTWYDHKIIIEGDKTTWLRDGVIVKTNEENIPDDIDLKVFFMVDRLSTGDSASQTLEIDSVRYWSEEGIPSAAPSITVTKEIFYPPTVFSPEGESGLGDFDYLNMSSTGRFRLNMYTPLDFTSLTGVYVVIYPDATETVQFDVTTDFGAVGEALTANSDSITNGTQAVTQNQITELDISAAFTDLAAGDYIGMEFQSDTSSIRAIGVRFKYT